MIHENDIKFPSEMFEVLLQMSTIIMVILVTVKFFKLVITEHVDSELENTYHGRRKRQRVLWNVARDEAYNSMQTPRRFSKKNVIELPSKPLIWSKKYKETPYRMMISNKKEHVLLEVEYSDSQPRLSGGPLDSEYSLQHIVFKWRPRNVKNWQNKTNNREYVLDLQAIHFKTEFLTRLKKFEDITPENMEKSPVVIINYVYKISEKDNFALEPMISRFGMIEDRGTSCFLYPFPLSWILPKFSEYYYIQQDSLLSIPFVQGVQWLLSPVQPTISKQQMDIFKIILNQNYTMKFNKSYKKINKEEIFFCSEIEEEPK